MENIWFDYNEEEICAFEEQTKLAYGIHCRLLCFFDCCIETNKGKKIGTEKIIIMCLKIVGFNRPLIFFT